jgi:hypothetical protein
MQKLMRVEKKYDVGLAGVVDDAMATNSIAKRDGLNLIAEAPTPDLICSGGEMHVHASTLPGRPRSTTTTASTGTEAAPSNPYDAPTLSIPCRQWP